MRKLSIIAAILLVGCSAEQSAPRVATVQNSQVDESSSPAKPEPLERPTTLTTSDRGVLANHDPNVQLFFPEWLTEKALVVLPHGDDRFAYMGDVAVGLVAADEVNPAIETVSYGDIDRDGIPDQLDILAGAKKTALNGATYKGGYIKLEYPNGDVPISEGVCTDVLVRALRNAGLDLQKELHEDIKARRRAFGMVKRPDTHIDHRRVKTLLPYFQKHWDSKNTDTEDLSTWVPGDIVFMQTMGDKRPDHVGIVSDRLGASGLPLVINNWTDGYSTSEMDILPLVPVTHRFRLKSRLEVEESERGVQGMLRRRGVSVPANHTQMLVVTADGWDSRHGELRHYIDSAQTGPPIPVTLGSSGLARGRGVSTLSYGPEKREGDQRAPAGVFLLGSSFGREALKPDAGWTHRQTTDKDIWVDAPDHPSYNRWLTGPLEASHEKLAMYALGVVVEHNTVDVQKGAGSAIFLHTWQSAEPSSTLGCTAMAHEHLESLIHNLDPSKSPVLVQLPGHIYE